MKLPRYIAKTPPPRSSGIARAQDIGALTRTGEAAAWKGISQVGGALQQSAGIGYQAYMHRQEIDDIIESGIATQRTQDSWNKANKTVSILKPIQDMPDPDDSDYLKTLRTFGKDKSDALLQDLLKDVEQDATKVFSGIRNPKTKAKLVNQYNDNYTNQVEVLKHNVNAKLNDYQLSEMNKLATAAAQNGNVDTANYYVDKMAEHGLITYVKATKLKGDNYKISVEETVAGLYRAGLHDEARKVLEDSSLSNTDKETLTIKMGAAKSRREKGQEENNFDAQSVLYKREDEGEILNREDFESAWTDPEKADRHYDEYLSGLNAEVKGEVNFVKKGDPIVLAKIEAAIDLNPMSITEEVLYTNATKGIGTENMTGLVDRLRKAKEGIYTPIKKYNSQFSTLLSAGYFGEKDKIETSTRYLEMKRKMKEYVDSQKPNEASADAYFGGLITKDFKGIRSGGWEEKGYKHTYMDISGNEVTQRFRFGDLRTRRIGKKTVEEFYAGTNNDGDPLWIPRR